MGQGRAASAQRRRVNPPPSTRSSKGGKPTFANTSIIRQITYTYVTGSSDMQAVWFAETGYIFV
ncbi:hypothetical protein GCM10020370_48820 [Paenibacillus hodogayensis]